MPSTAGGASSYLDDSTTEDRSFAKGNTASGISFIMEDARWSMIEGPESHKSDGKF